jgi:hypothetical protein
MQVCLNLVHESLYLWTVVATPACGVCQTTHQCNVQLLYRCMKCMRFVRVKMKRLWLARCHVGGLTSQQQCEPSCAWRVVCCDHNLPTQATWSRQQCNGQPDCAVRSRRPQQKSTWTASAPAARGQFPHPSRLSWLISAPAPHLTSLSLIVIPLRTPAKADKTAARMGPGPPPMQQQQQQPPGLPPVGPDEQRLSAAAGRASADVFGAIQRLAGADPAAGEIETTAHIQDIFRALRALLSDIKMAVDEQDT